MGVKKKKIDFIIEPSPLMPISSEIVDSNRSNLERAGLWSFICKRWPIADSDRVLTYLIGSNRGSQEEFRIQGQIVHFDVNVIKKHFPGLSSVGPTLVAIELLDKAAILQVFEQPGNARVDSGYSIHKAKGPWKEWLQYVNQRLLMAPEGVEVITSEGLAAAYRSWSGEPLNWTKILFNQIRSEIAGKTTRNRLFFYSSTYLSEFCPILMEPSSHTRDTVEEGISSKNKRRKYIASSPEECEVDMDPGILEASQRSSPDVPWRSVMGTPEPEPIEYGSQVSAALFLSSDDPPLIRKKSQSSSSKRINNPLALINKTMTVDVISQKEKGEESVKSRSEGIHKIISSKSTSTKKNKQEHENEDIVKECEQLELLVTEKDDLVVQYQTSMKEILKAKDELEKKLQVEKEKLLLELKKATAVGEDWKKRCSEYDSNILQHDELKAQVGKLTHDLKEAMQKLEEQNSLYHFEKENGVKLAKEIAVLIQQHAKEMHKAKLNNSMINLVPPPDVVNNLEQSIRSLTEANVQLQTQVTKGQELKLKLQENLWWKELEAPPSFSLFHSYELQRDTFLKIFYLTRGTLLEESEFDKLWLRASHFPNMQNLICEMIARNDLKLANPSKLIIPIGDLGARVLLYYMTLESQLEYKHQADKPGETFRHVYDLEAREVNLALLQNPELFLEWKPILELLSQELQREQAFAETLSLVHMRENIAQRGEFTTSHYIFGRVCASQRLKKILEGISCKTVDFEEYCTQARMSEPPANFKPPTYMNLPTPISGSFLKQRYLGRYESLFNSDEELPFPSWSAIEWILEDFGLSRKTWKPWDKLYPRVSQAWSNFTPVAVTTNPHLCPVRGLRRCKWAPWAKIDTIPYNWPQIPGLFSTFHDCIASYKTFFEIHKNHTDPVCFRAAIFCNVLAYLCMQYKLVVNVNHYDESKPEFHIWMKLQQKPARCIRILECMAITHFLNGPSSVFTLEFSNKRQEQLDSWLTYQKQHDTHLIHDVDVRRNLDVMDMQTVTRAMEIDDEFKNKKPRQEYNRRP
jgi:hypothetical protein